MLRHFGFRRQPPPPLLAAAMQFLFDFLPAFSQPLRRFRRRAFRLSSFRRHYTGGFRHVTTLMIFRFSFSIDYAERQLSSTDFSDIAAAISFIRINTDTPLIYCHATPLPFRHYWHVRRLCAIDIRIIFSFGDFAITIFTPFIASSALFILIRLPAVFLRML